MKYKKILTSSIILASIIGGGFLINPASADVHTSGGASGGSGGAPGGFNFSPGYSNYVGAGLGLSWVYGNGGTVLGMPRDINIFTSALYQRTETRLTGKWAYLSMPDMSWSGSAAELNVTHRTIWPLNDKLNGHNGIRINMQSLTLNGTFTNYIRNEKHAGTNGYAYIYGGQRVDALSIDAVPIHVPEKRYTDKRTTIVKVVDPRVPSHNIDTINKGLKWNYDNVRTNAAYGDQSTKSGSNSGIGGDQYNNNITSKVYDVTKTTVYPGYTYMSNQKNPGYGSPNISYSKSEKNYNTNFKYNVSQPAREVKYFTPWNLNKANGQGNNGLMNSAKDVQDIKASFPTYNGNTSTPGLKIQPNNLQNIVDGKDLNTLDTNSSVSFDLTWKNNQFGIPTASEGGFDLLDNAPDFSKLTWSNGVTGKWSASGSYSKGNTDLTGRVSPTMRWGGNLTAAINNKNASLSFNGGEEKVGPTALNISKPAAGSKSSFTFKTIQIGGYNLTNGTNVPFFTANYNNGNAYTYGFKYNGTITTKGFNAPSSVTTNLYDGAASSQVNQPVLRGTLNAATVAGNNHN